MRDDGVVAIITWMHELWIKHANLVFIYGVYFSDGCDGDIL